MIAYAIKFSGNTYYEGYYAGCNKSTAKTLLGAQLYKSEKAAQNVIDHSANFPSYRKDKLSIVKVELNEISDV